MFIRQLLLLAAATGVIALDKSTASVNLTASISKHHVHDESFVPDAVLVITEQNITQSCLPPKPVVLVNGTTPGPALYLEEGKASWVRVYNNLTLHNATMHWHGISEVKSPWSDGTPKISQWPIPPMHYFDYEITPSNGSAGSYWYHSHVKYQDVSCNGPLIVVDPEPVFEYDDERLFFVTDTFKETDAEIVAGILAQNNWSVGPNTNAMLVNGKGGGQPNGTMCNASLSTIDVEAGKTYRIRFTAATSLSLFNVVIEGHDVLELIAVDGGYVKPYNLSYMQMGPGQRYDVLLRTLTNTTKTDFVIQLMSLGRGTTVYSYANLHYGTNSSTVYYPPPSPPLISPNLTNDYLDYVLEPYYQKDIDDFPKHTEVTRRVYIRMHEYVVGNATSYEFYGQDGVTWVPSDTSEPFLVSLYKNDGVEFPSMERALANWGIDPKVRAFPAEIGEVLEIVLQNTGSGANSQNLHPWHAHGQHPYDCGSGMGAYDPVLNEMKLNGTQPIKRDTSVVMRAAATFPDQEDGGWRVWRIRVEAPGAWNYHCHITNHMGMGMQLPAVFGNSSEVLKLGLPDVEGYLTYGGSVYGNSTHSPSGVLHFSDDWADEQ